MTWPRGPELCTTRATKFRMSESGKTQTSTYTVDDQPNLDLPSTEPKKTNSLHPKSLHFLNDSYLFYVFGSNSVSPYCTQFSISTGLRKIRKGNATRAGHLQKQGVQREHRNPSNLRRNQKKTNTMLTASFHHERRLNR